MNYISWFDHFLAYTFANMQGLRQCRRSSEPFVVDVGQLHFHKSVIGQRYENLHGYKTHTWRLSEGPLCTNMIIKVDNGPASLILQVCVS